MTLIPGIHFPTNREEPVCPVLIPRSAISPVRTQAAIAKKTIYIPQL